MPERFNKKYNRRSFLALSGMTAASAVAGCSGKSGQPGQWAGLIRDKDKCPVVVIGAGLGGLTAAAYLAKHGFQVTVVEKHGKPGGYATSFRRGRGRYTFEVSLHQTAVRGTFTEHVITELDLWNQVAPVPVPEFARVITRNYDVTLPSADPEGFIRTVSTLYPDEEAGIRKVIGEFLEIASATQQVSDPESMNLWELASFPFRHELLWNIRNMTLAEMLDRHVRSAGLKDLLACLWGYYGLPPSKLSAFYYATATGQYIKNGGCYLWPRSQSFSNTLKNHIESHGGWVRVKQEAQYIHISNGAVDGVQLVGGEYIPAKAVISNAAAPLTMNMVQPDGAPSGYRDKLAAYRPSISSFIVWLGLNRDITNAVSTYGTFIRETGSDAEENYRACLQADASRAPFAVTIYDNICPGYSRPGDTTLMLMFCCGYEPWRCFETDYRAGRKKEYRRIKEKMARCLIQRTERCLVPNLSRYIEVMVTASPLTNIRFTGNCQGAIYGYEQSVDNSFINRLRNRTPVGGLYLAGAWGFPGGGYTGAMRGGRKAFMDMAADCSIS